MAGELQGDRTVIVGIDGSAGSAAALRWATDHADHLGTIVPTMTFVTGLYAYGFDPDDGSMDRGGPYRQEAVDRLRTFLEEHQPSMVGAGSVIEGRAGAALVDAAVGAELLVVGSHGWGSRVDLSIGSVGAYCARYSVVPVAVIPPAPPAVHDHLDVVVGFDGSDHAVNALRWTLTHLRRTATVFVVRAHAGGSVIGDPLSPSPETAELAAGRALEASVAPVLAAVATHPAVELVIAPGDPREVLRTAAVDADLLVVGSRGHGVLEHLLLGSVASALVHHPTVPTIIVPHRHRSS
jgi:nucleotide-binding universal stress UspA family protein